MRDRVPPPHDLLQEFQDDHDDQNPRTVTHRSKEIQDFKRKSSHYKDNAIFEIYIIVYKIGFTVLHLHFLMRYISRVRSKLIISSIFTNPSASHPAAFQCCDNSILVCNIA